ncbi:hypothetical protein RchiOBHm_Chr3g0452051 [Rosa chinensis]|uniref:Uncharacterized protein n=1 Tax=Rosa chinensis TaxID=74649 RepID=A0A2P6R661_ROSCH|nr:hypothetical protein RchiOBHm_Chr3g0452051 [Rosa chinensis]
MYRRHGINYRKTRCSKLPRLGTSIATSFFEKETNYLSTSLCNVSLLKPFGQWWLC